MPRQRTASGGIIGGFYECNAYIVAGVIMHSGCDVGGCVAMSVTAVYDSLSNLKMGGKGKSTIQKCIFM